MLAGIVLGMEKVAFGVQKL